MNPTDIRQLCGSPNLTTQPQQGKPGNHTFLQKGNVRFHTIRPTRVYFSSEHRTRTSTIINSKTKITI